MIALIGSEGSMGKRYQAILNHFKQEYLPLDKSKPEADSIIKKASKCERIIIATPTETHVGYLKDLLPLKKPILCEKPITKNLDELIDLHAECQRKGWSYQMVMQYKELTISKEPQRWSYYNYFKHGSDGIVWDCIQIVGLAEGPVWLKEDSPFWECTINGRQLSIADMDMAYVSMVKRWLMNSLDQTMDEIIHVHKKVVEFQEKNAA